MRRASGATRVRQSSSATTFNQFHRFWQLGTIFALGTKQCFAGHCALLLVFGTLTKVSICSAHLSRQLWGWRVSVPDYWCPCASCWIDLQWYVMRCLHYLRRTGMVVLPVAVEVGVFFLPVCLNLRSLSLFIISPWWWFAVGFGHLVPVTLTGNSSIPSQLAQTVLRALP